jgi:putative transport protein
VNCSQSTNDVYPTAVKLGVVLTLRDTVSEVLISGSGVSWILAGAFLTLFPLLLVGFVARIIVKLDFATVCGVLAGSMTDPPALAFAGTITHSDRPLVAYAAVYPLVMILRVFVVQILILTLPA